MLGAAGRCGAHHTNIHRSDHWVVGETEETLEEIDGNPDPDPKRQSLFRHRFDRLAAPFQELVEQRVAPVQAWLAAAGIQRWVADRGNSGK